MKNVLRFCWLSMVPVLALSGCATLAGHWESTSISPEMARDQFQLIRSTNATGEFIQAKVTLNKDGRYVAEVSHAGGNSLTRGAWEYSIGRLMLNDDKFGEHSYAADLAGNGKTLQIVQTIKGTDVVLTMTRRKTR